MITCRLIVGSIDVCVMLFCDGFLCADGTFCNRLVRGKIREERREKKKMSIRCDIEEGRNDSSSSLIACALLHLLLLLLFVTTYILIALK